MIGTQHVFVVARLYLAYSQLKLSPISYQFSRQLVAIDLKKHCEHSIHTVPLQA